MEMPMIIFWKSLEVEKLLFGAQFLTSLVIVTHITARVMFFFNLSFFGLGLGGLEPYIGGVTLSPNPTSLSKQAKNPEPVNVYDE